jgi:hypothetical protein
MRPPTWLSRPSVGQPAVMSRYSILPISRRQYRITLSGRGPTLIPVLLWALLVSAVEEPARAEVSVDLLYDFRHTTDPQDNANSFPVVELKLFFPQSFGSFLMKSEIDLDGADHNPSQTYTELSQSLKLGSATLWGQPLFIHLGYSGGLGSFGAGAGSFYIQNAYQLGLEYPFQVDNAFCNAYVALRYTTFEKPSYDPMLALYAGRYFLNYKLLLANSFEGWTTSKDQGSTTQHDSGKFTSWELETEVWYKVGKDLSVGTYVRTTRNVYAADDRWLVYPSVGVRYAF